MAAMSRGGSASSITYAVPTGSLAASIIDANAECSRVLRYIAVDRSAAMRSDHVGRLPLAPLEEVLKPEPESHIRSRCRCPMVASVAELPAGPLTGVLFANELLDNLPVDLFEFQHGAWHAVCVGVTKQGDLTEVLQPLPAAWSGKA